MATFRAFTTIEQSKVLTEILTLESADGHWYNGSLGLTYSQEAKDFYDSVSNEYLPAWSLSALLNAIPYNVSFNKAVYRFKLVKFSDHWECYHENFGSVNTEIFKADNSVDACVAMIEKLHKLKML